MKKTGIDPSNDPQGRAPPRLADPITRMATLVSGAPPGRRVVLGLVGLPGAGKSTLAQQWVDRLNQELGAGTAMVIGMDGFHLTRAQLAALPDPAAALARRGAPWTFDPQALAQRLQALSAMPTDGSDSVPWPGFAHGVGDPVADAVTIKAPVRLVLLEGLYLLHRDHGWDLSAWLQECWYLDVPLEQALDRLRRRHMASWGISQAQASARIDRNDRLNAAIVAADRFRADWWVADRPR